MGIRKAAPNGDKPKVVIKLERILPADLAHYFRAARSALQ